MKRTLKEQSAVKVAPEKFTWMKYKGIKAKLLTHTKRNGDVVKTRLEPNDVFGYRNVKQRSTGKELIQIVLKSDNMDLAYNLVVRSFNTHILKHSKATVLPKKFKKPIDVKTIDKKAPAEPKVSTKAPALKTQKDKLTKQIGLDTPENDSDDSTMRESKKDLGDDVLNTINGWGLPTTVAKALWGSSGHLQVKWDGSKSMAASVYVAVYDSKLMKREKTAGIKQLLKDRTRTGIYNAVVGTAANTIAVALKEHNLDRDAFSPIDPDNSEVKVFKSSSNPGHNYTRILIGYVNHIQDTPEAAQGYDQEVQAIIDNIGLDDEDMEYIEQSVKGTTYEMIGVMRFVEFVYDNVGQNLSDAFDDLQGFFSTDRTSGITKGLVIDNQGQPLINNFKKNYLDQDIDEPEIVPTPKDKPSAKKKVDRTTDVEKFIRAFLTQHQGGNFFNLTIDTNFSDRTTYSMTGGLNEKPINLAYEQLMDEIKDEFGKLPKTVSEEVEERTFNSMIVKYEKELHGTEFTMRLRKVKNSVQVKLMFVEFIFPT